MAFWDIPKTRSEAVATVDELLDWDYGYGEGGVFSYVTPNTAATVADRDLYMLPMGAYRQDLAWSIDECWNATLLSYRSGDNTISEHEDTGTSVALGSTTRRRVISSPGSYMSDAQAAVQAAADLADHLEPPASGTLTVSGEVERADGRTVHCLEMKAGQMVRLVDETGETERTLKIVRVTKRPLQGAVDIEVGRNPRGLERLIARMDAKVKKR
jgi:hypothetical protein